MVVSALGHVALFSYLGLRSIGLTGPDLHPSAPPPMVYLRLEPRPLLPGEATRVPRPPPIATDDIAAPARRGAPPADRSRPFRDPDEDEAPPAGPTPRPGGSAVGGPKPPPPGPDGWSVRPQSPGHRIGQSLRTRGPGCADPLTLTATERSVCDDRFGERAAAAAPIAGTGDRERDARFARQGARALARYEARRAPLSDADDPPCERGRSPIASCEVEIQVDLFSSTRGWLPNLRADDD